MATYQRVNVVNGLLILNIICVITNLFNPVLSVKPNDEREGKGIVQMEKDEIDKVNLAKSAECQEDFNKYCQGFKDTSNFAVMRCFSDKYAESPEAISKECQHLVWEYKMKLTVDPRIEKNAEFVCKDDIDKHCRDSRGKPGHVISCLIETLVQNNEKEEQAVCRQFLHKILTIVFEDWKFMEPYFSKCQSDIKILKCGRYQGSEPYLGHNEGGTIECLQHPDNKDRLSQGCREELLKIAQLQADDYHMDRPLYYACKSAHQLLCGDVVPGNGAVYSCLMQKANDKLMPEKCRELLLRRQKLIDEKIEVDESFFSACEEDIKKFDCIKEPGDHHRRETLLCLEEKEKEGEKLSAECMAQIQIQRGEIIDNPDIDDKFSVACKPALDYCKKKIGAAEDSAMMHCLLDVLKASKESPKKLPFKVTKECLQEAKILLEEVEISSQIIMDKSLRKACQKDLDHYCSEKKGGDAGQLGCLMTHVEGEKLNPLCKKFLHQIQYFVARDYRLDDELRDSCHKDAVRICHAPKKWRRTKEEEKNFEAQEVFVLPCLYRHRDQVDATCREAVKRLMHERAESVDLMPEIETPCMNDLSQKCSDKLGKGEEIQCLEDNLENLEAECKKAMEEFIEEEGEDPELDRMMVKACEVPMAKFCKKDENQEDLDAEDIVECMIEHKHHPDMPAKCTAQINHYELVLLKEVKFNKKFHQNCQGDIDTHCTGKKTQYEALICLSDQVRKDIVHGKGHKISKNCRHQLQSELFKRTKDIELDPNLKHQCEFDIKKFCNDVPPGPGEVIQCLKNHHKKLQKNCVAVLFKREVVEAAMKIVDSSIITACKSMIKRFCSDMGKNVDKIDCLERHQHDENFDQKCYETLVQYQINANQDYRLNEALRENCIEEIEKYCSHITKDQKDDEMLEGKVIGCLKEQFLKKKLSEQCKVHIVQIIEEAALNYREDAQLVEKCHDDILKLCKEEISNSDDNDDLGNPKHAGNVEDCLKSHFQKIKNPECQKEVARIIAEGRADVHADPHLYEMCQKVITSKCHEIPFGEGRVMNCLLGLLEENKISGRCKMGVESRKMMWEYASRFAPPETFEDLFSHINSSSSRFYFYSIIMVVFFTLLILGILFGRVTKRIRAEVKNR